MSEEYPRQATGGPGSSPANASILVRMFVLKAWLIGFDLDTLIAVIALLRLCRLPVGLCVVYAWCPLLLKEIANSGHLDAIAVFLTTLAFCLAARLVARPLDGSRAPLGIIANGMLMAAVLALAVGAKLYPIVGAPLLFFVLAKNVGWRRLFPPIAAFAVATVLILAPMIPPPMVPAPASSSFAPAASADEAASPPALPAPAADPSRGIRVFLQHREMNDFLFLIIVENLRPTADLPAERIAWFSVLPQSVRQAIVEGSSTRFGIAAADTPLSPAP